MKPFNNQFATQRLLQEAEGPFYVVFNRGYGQGKGIANDYKPFPSLEAAQAFADKMNDLGSGTFSKFQKHYYVIGSDHEDFEWVSQAAHDKGTLDKEIGESLNEVKFTIDDGDLYSAVMDRYMRGASIQDMLIKDEGDYLETDEETFQGIQAIAMDLDKVDALVRLGDMEETSATGAGANFVPGTGEQLATPKAFKKKNEQKDVEPKLAAGKAKVYMKDKWGWKEAPSIPNRPSKGGFIYKQLFEGEKGIDATYESLVKILETLHSFSDKIEFSTQEVNGYYNIVYDDPKQITKDCLKALRSHKFWNTEFAPSVAIFDNNRVNINFEKPGQEILNIKDFDNSNWMPKKLKQSVNENYSRFKKETKFIYKQLFEALSKEANEAEWPSEVPSRYGEYIFKLVKVMPDGAMYDVIDVETGKKELGGRAYRSVETLKYAAADLVKPKGGTQSTQLEENYSRFKKETKTRTNEQQLHAAMRLAEKKIHEANRILEYTSQLRSELNETRVNKNTQKLMEKITRGIAEAYGKMKKLK